MRNKLLAVCVLGLETSRTLAGCTDEAGRTVHLRQAISLVEPRSPASDVGLQVDDVILSYADTPIFDRNGLMRAVEESGDEVAPLVVDRDGQTLSFDVTLRGIGIDVRSRLVADPSPDKPAS